MAVTPSGCCLDNRNREISCHAKHRPRQVQPQGRTRNPGADNGAKEIVTEWPRRTVLEAEHYLLKVKLKRDRVDSFEQYPFSLPTVRDLDALELHPGVTFRVGENGSGKSTLLEAIAVAWGFNAEGGSRNFRFRTAHH